MNTAEAPVAKPVRESLWDQPLSAPGLRSWDLPNSHIMKAVHAVFRRGALGWTCSEDACRCFKLTADKSVLRELLLPMTSKLDAPSIHGFRGSLRNSCGQVQESFRLPDSPFYFPP